MEAAWFDDFTLREVDHLQPVGSDRFPEHLHHLPDTRPGDQPTHHQGGVQQVDGELRAPTIPQDPTENFLPSCGHTGWWFTGHELHAGDGDGASSARHTRVHQADDPVQLGQGCCDRRNVVAVLTVLQHLLQQQWVLDQPRARHIKKRPEVKLSREWRLYASL